MRRPRNRRYLACDGQEILRKWAESTESTPKRISTFLPCSSISHLIFLGFHDVVDLINESRIVEIFRFSLQLWEIKWSPLLCILHYSFLEMLRSFHISSPCSFVVANSRGCVTDCFFGMMRGCRLGSRLPYPMVRLHPGSEAITLSPFLSGLHPRRDWTWRCLNSNSANPRSENASCHLQNLKNARIFTSEAFSR